MSISELCGDYVHNFWGLCGSHICGIVLQIRDELSNEVKELKKANPNFRPTLAIVQLGQRADSTAYVSAKMKATEECGLQTKKVHLSEGSFERVYLFIVYQNSCICVFSY
jgi:5,10-methylene-tetrahydrofolate dehydrogenase/methenyl tetrahydrofolate cyclohydrolase